MDELAELAPCGNCGAKADALCEGCFTTVCKRKRCTKKHEACATSDDWAEFSAATARLGR